MAFNSCARCADFHDEDTHLILLLFATLTSSAHHICVNYMDFMLESDDVRSNVAQKQWKAHTYSQQQRRRRTPNHVEHSFPLHNNERIYYYSSVHVWVYHPCKHFNFCILLRTFRALAAIMFCRRMWAALHYYSHWAMDGAFVRMSCVKNEKHFGIDGSHTRGLMCEDGFQWVLIVMWYSCALWARHRHLT